MSVPVYVFNGFLEAGKTQFINETLSSDSFAKKRDRVLIISCEEGEEQYDFMSYFCKNVFCEKLESKSQLNADKLGALLKKNSANLVIIEYNGMWRMPELYDALPENWEIAEIMTFIDSDTFPMFYNNMRDLFTDKVIDSGFIVFNRCVRDETDETVLHKAVRASNTFAKIAYEYTDGSYTLDNIEDPLPFDKNADVIEIGIMDYGKWYRDLSENMPDYEGKTVKFTCFVQNNKKTAPGVVVGRYVMSCCEADAQFCGLYADGGMSMCANEIWAEVTAKITVKPCKIYGRPGPVLDIISCEQTAQPANPISTFV